MTIDQPQTSFNHLLSAPNIVTSEDVFKFRAQAFQDGVITEQEASALIALNRGLSERCQEWNVFLIEVLSQHVVHQVEPRGYISDENAAWLMNELSTDGVVESALELEMLISTMAKSRSCPASLAQFALLQVSVAVVNGEGPLARGGKLTKGVIGEAEVELLRTMLYASCSENALAISKSEAEVLVQLNEITNGANNHPAWRDLFVRATANYLMSTTNDNAPSRDEALAREAWLEDTEVDVKGFFEESVAGFGNLLSSDFFEDIFTSAHVQSEKMWKARNDKFAASTATAQAVDSVEANWLIERIKRDGVVNDNEQALIEFISTNSTQIDPALEAMIDEVA